MMTDIKKTANRVRAKLKGKLDKPGMYRMSTDETRTREKYVNNVRMCIISHSKLYCIDCRFWHLALCHNSIPVYIDPLEQGME